MEKPVNELKLYLVEKASEVYNRESELDLCKYEIYEEIWNKIDYRDFDYVVKDYLIDITR